jgi:hypothetical protein
MDSRLARLEALAQKMQTMQTKRASEQVGN